MRDGRETSHGAPGRNRTCDTRSSATSPRKCWSSASLPQHRPAGALLPGSNPRERWMLRHLSGRAPHASYGHRSREAGERRERSDGTDREPDEAPVRMDENGTHADAFRARELIVRSVTDEDRVFGLYAELLAREQVDARVGLAQSDKAGEDDGAARNPKHDWNLSYPERAS
jgi:hypothetical protein